MKLCMTREDFERLTGRSYSDKGVSLTEAKTVWTKKPYSGGGGSTKYVKPTGWVKPETYPGLKQSAEHMTSMKSGVLDLGLVNPDEVVSKNTPLKKSVFRNLVRLLVQTKGSAKISDPEWVLKGLYPGQMIKSELALDLGTALGDLFEMPIDVTVSGSQNIKGGFGWFVSAPALSKVLANKKAEEWVEAVESYLEAV
jgi:hypothetical protein